MEAFRTRALILAAFVALALSFVALPASATCQVESVGAYPDINYTTLCALDEGTTFDDGTQHAQHDYLAHMSHATEADPAFDYSHAFVQRDSWTYDDGDVHQERQTTDVGAGAWEGVRGVVGTGAQADLNQRDQTTPEDDASSGACSGWVGHSTCSGASGWLTVQDIASVGVGAYSMQTGTGDSCSQSYEVDVDAVAVFVPVTTGPMACAAELPWLYDSPAWDALPTLA